MDLKDMTQKLIDGGFSQGAIAKALTARGVPCSQPTIWRILNDETEPSYRVGCAIQELYIETIEAAA